MNASIVLIAAVVVLATGMALVFTAVVVPGLTGPGVILITAGLLGCAAAGVLEVIRASTGRNGADDDT